MRLSRVEEESPRRPAGEEGVGNLVQYQKASFQQSTNQIKASVAQSAARKHGLEWV